MINMMMVMAGDAGDLDPTAHTGLDRVQIASLLIGVFIPILVGLVTKRATNPAVKSAMLLGLSGVSGFLTEYVNSHDFVWQQALTTTIVTFVIGVATYYGLWTPTGVTSRAQGAFGGDNPPGEQGRVSPLVAVGLVVLAVVVLILLL